MKVENWPIERVIPYARNPRKNDEAVSVVAASLQEFGWQQPLVVDAAGVLLVGHTRLKAAQRLGWSEVPVQVASDLTPAKAKAYRIMDNRSGEKAEWDMDLLALELEDLRLEDFDLDLTGFEADALAELLDSAAPLDEMPALPDGDKAPFQQMTFTLHDTQADQVAEALRAAKAMGDFIDSPNENSNGNALARICETFLTAHA